MTKIFIGNNLKKTNNKLFLALMLIGCLLFGSLTPNNAHAATEALCTMIKDPGGSGKMIDNPQFKITKSTIVSDIVAKIKQRLTGITSKTYGIVIANISFLAALQGVLTLYIVIYGILFTTGMVPMKLYDFINRLIKIGIIVMLTSPSSWTFFNGYVITFFDSLTDNTILYITNAKATSVPIINSTISGLNSLSVLDSVVSKVISSKMFAALLAAALTNAYGPFYFLLLLLSILAFLKSLMTAMWVYIMSLVMKTLLYGLAPIFIPTILFQRTKHIFDGWVAQLVNATLQPILLFIFFIFFVKLLEGSLDSILQTPICFSQLPDGQRGSPFDVSFWRFMDFSTGEWKVNTKEWSLDKQFPLSIVSVLTFFTISEIASRFNTVVIQISSQISQATTNLSAGVEGAFGTMWSSFGAKK